MPAAKAIFARVKMFKVKVLYRFYVEQEIDSLKTKGKSF